MIAGGVFLAQRVVDDVVEEAKREKNVKQ